MGTLSAISQSVKRGMAEPLRSCVVPFSVPMEPDLEKGWRPLHLFQGSTVHLTHLSCHVSILVPGHCPHPPHAHQDEEILLLLSGSVDLLLPQPESQTDVDRTPLNAGQFVFYPSGHLHTIETTGDQPANYLMLRWNAPERRLLEGMGCRFQNTGELFKTTRLMDGPTRCLRRMEVHLSVMAPGDGYEPHADHHEVAIILLEGEVETLGVRFSAPAAVFYRSGDPHGMHNPGNDPARYLVVEFHGSDVPFRDSLPIRLLMKAVRLVIPRRVRRKLRHLLGRRDGGSGDRS